MFPSLPSVIDYFRNVESIGSLNLTLDTVNTEGDALVISTNPGLQGVDLSRLRSVHFGNVRVRNNPELCYVGDFQTTTSNNSVYLTETQLILPTGPTNFMSVEDCSTFPALTQLHLPILCVLFAMACLRPHACTPLRASAASLSHHHQQQHAAAARDCWAVAVCLHETENLRCLTQYVTLVKGPPIQIPLPVAITIVL